MLGLKKKVGIEIDPPAADAVEEARRARNGVRPLGPAEAIARRDLAKLATGDGYIEPDELLGFGASVADVRRGARGRGRPQRLVPREAVEGHRRAGRSAGSSRSSSASSRSSRA